VTRVASAVVLVALVGGVLWFGPWSAALALAAIVAAVAAAEVGGLSAAIGAPVPTFMVSVSAIVACALVPIGMTNGDAAILVTSTMVLGGCLVTLASGPPSTPMITRAAVLTFAPLYVGLPLGAMTWIHLIHGPRTLAFVIATIAISDSAQYAAGRAFGRRKLAPMVSPAKTVEGALGGLVAAMLVGLWLGPLWGQAESARQGAALGAVLCLAGIMGDLFESLLKRSAGVKDSGTLIPGHGGVLDRIDAYLFAVPAYMLFLRYFG
jgi:phosphatidate cytidylyltransferase